jgi:hypothetical protein
LRAERSNLYLNIKSKIEIATSSFLWKDSSQ